MKIKPISETEFKKLLKLENKKLDSRLDWFSHIGSAYATEVGGRLHYTLNVKIARNISEFITVRYTVPNEGDYTKKLEIVKG